MSLFTHLALRPRSMRARMTALFALLVALLMLGAGAAVQQRERRRAEHRTRDALTVAIEMADWELHEQEGKGSPVLDVVRREQGELAAGGLVLLVAEASGKVLWQSRHSAPAWPTVGDDWRFKTLSREGQTLIVAREWRPIEEELKDTTKGLWLLGVITVAGTAMLAWFVVGQTLSPLDRLAEQAQNASIESLQVRLHSPSSDAEMNHLTATLNSLLGRLEKEAQARGRFYAAASHELRTPIQVLLGEVDVARSRSRTMAEYQDVLAQVQSHTERLALLVSDLLQLNALEMRQNQAPCEPLNLAFWVERAGQQQAAAMQEQGLELECDLTDTTIVAPATHLEMLLRNLLENAVKYSTPDTTIQITLAMLGEGSHFEVWNACELPPDTVPSAWFEPFFRPDASRSSQTGGNGLGLAICRAICSANGWKMTLTPEKGGLSAKIDFPLANPHDETALFASNIN